MKKITLPFNLGSRKKKEKTFQQNNRRLVIGLVLRLIFLFMFAAAMIWVIIGLVTGSSLIVPQSAGGVLKSAQRPQSYSWSAESVRLVNLGGKNLRQDAVRQSTVALNFNSYFSVSAGALPDKTIYSSDGKVMLRLTQGDISAGNGWQYWSNKCKNDPPVPAIDLAMPTARQISRLSPEIISDQGSYLNQQAWVISFKPSPTLISNLLGLPFYQKAESPAANRWVLSNSERRLLRLGKFKTDVARVWVLRSGERPMVQIEIRFRFDGGSAWHLLSRKLKNKPLPSKPVSFGNPCGSDNKGTLIESK